MAAERVIEKDLVQGVKIIGGWAIKLLPDFVRGIPDRLVLYRGRAYFVETKAGGQKPRASQLLIHRKLFKLGFIVEVLDSREAVQTFINYIK